MRFRHLSLTAALALVVFSGCSAARNRFLPTAEGTDDTRIPPRHDHEYSPAPDRSDDFREPDPRSPLRTPGEPVPAPPALGISRVKSVSWLKDMGARLNRKPVTSEVCADERLVGKCSPVEPCVPASECLPSTGCLTDSIQDSCCESPCEKPVARPGMIARTRKTVSKILGRKRTGLATAVCAEKDCAEESCASGYQFRSDAPGIRRSAEIPHRESRECLADPLGSSEEEEFDDPGLIMPSDRRPLHSSDPILPVLEAFEDSLPLPDTSIESPAENLPIPEPPQLPIPDAAVPSVPLEPDGAGSSSRFVEPPMWPRLRGNQNSAMTPVSHAVTTGTRRQPSAGSRESQPLVIPRPRQ